MAQLLVTAANGRSRRQGVIRRTASEGPLLDRDRAFVVAVLADRSCPDPDLHDCCAKRLSRVASCRSPR